MGLDDGRVARLPTLGYVCVEAIAEIYVWGIIDKVVVRAERPLRRDQMIEVQRDQSTRLQDVFSTPVDVSTGHDTLHVG